MLLVAVTWASAAIFGLYILAFFGGTAAARALDRWNESLPGLHTHGQHAATLSLGAHLAGGGLLLLLGPVQLIGSLRRRAPALHRWLGRAYLLAAAAAGLGGLGFIVARGTIGGGPMDAGFGLYGLLMLVAAARAYATARARRFEAHRAWAIRLFALAIGSWLYRIEYGFWFVTVGPIGHRHDFRGAFDVAMTVFFYLPNLAVAEAFIRGRGAAARAPVRATATALLLGATGFVLLATWSFAHDHWGPGIVSGLTGAPL